MADTEDVEVDVVVWRRYWVAAKQVHRRVWFWLLLGFVLMTVLAAALWCHQPRCNDVEAPFPVAVDHPHHPHVPPVVVVPPAPVALPAPPPATPPAHRVAHVAHRVVHHTKHHRCCCHCCR